MQPSGEVGQFEVVHLPSPPADRYRSATRSILGDGSHVESKLTTAHMNPPIGTSFKFKVKHSAQGASGGSYYVRFDVDATLLSADEFDVAFESIYPNDPAPSDLDAAKLAITNGFRDALTSCNFGAKIIVTQLALHPVDFNPGKYGYWAHYHLTQQLAAAGFAAT